MTIRVSIALAACALALAAPASAQEKACHTSTSHAVQEMPNAEMVGATFYIADAAKGCVETEVEADIVIGDGTDPLWFSELRGDKLVLTRSTGPQGDLVVHDLSADARLLDVPADEFSVDDSSITYWERSEQATRETCAEFAEYEASGFGAVISVEKRLTFGEARPGETGARRCDATQ